MLKIFRKLFKKKDDLDFEVQSHMAYICDPTKNVECNKKFCGVLHLNPEECLCTKKKKYAMYKDKVSVFDEDRNLARSIEGMGAKGPGFYENYISGLGEE